MGLWVKVGDNLENSTNWPMAFPNTPLQTAKGNVPFKVKTAFSLATALEVTSKNEGVLREALGSSTEGSLP